MTSEETAMPCPYAKLIVGIRQCRLLYHSDATGNDIKQWGNKVELCGVFLLYAEIISGASRAASVGKCTDFSKFFRLRKVCNF